MDTKNKLISAAGSLFSRHGFNATGMDRLTQAAGMSSRTLYKHAGSKTALIVRVLEARDQRFFAQMEEQSIKGLFDALDDWLREEGCLGCLFLRAYGETGGDNPQIAAVIRAHKEKTWQTIRRLVASEIGHEDDRLAEQILILFEGATAAAIYRGVGTVATARNTAALLLAGAKT